VYVFIRLSVLFFFSFFIILQQELYKNVLYYFRKKDIEISVLAAIMISLFHNV